MERGDPTVGSSKTRAGNVTLLHTNIINRFGQVQLRLVTAIEVGASPSLPFIANFNPAPAHFMMTTRGARRKEGGNPARAPSCPRCTLESGISFRTMAKEIARGCVSYRHFRLPLRQKRRIRQAVNHLLFFPSPALSLGHPSRLCSLPPQLTVGTVAIRILPFVSIYVSWQGCKQGVTSYTGRHGMTIQILASMDLADLQITERICKGK